jgi:hypothetical protein
MVVTPLLIAFGSVCAGALAASAFARPRERQPAVVLACFLFASWMVTVATWTPWSIDLLLTAYTPFEVHSIDVWATLNGAGAILSIYLAWQFWWGWALWALLTVACANDVVWWLHLVEWRQFSANADMLFMAEEAVFLYVGGKGLKDAAYRFVQRHGGWFLPVRAVLSPAKALIRRVG